MYIKNMGPRMLACGIPLLTIYHCEKHPFRCFRLHRKSWIQRINLQSISHAFNLLINPRPLDAMHKRGLYRHTVSVRPFVRLSVTFVDSVKTNKYIFNFFYNAC